MVTLLLTGFRRAGIGTGCGTLECLHDRLAGGFIQVVERGLYDGVVRREHKVVAEELLAVAAAQSIVVGAEAAFEEATEGS